MLCAINPNLLSFIITVIVMLALSAALITGWAVFAHFRVKAVNGGKCDDELKEELKAEREKFIKKNGGEDTGYVQFLNAVPKSARIKRIIDNVIFALVTAIMVALSAFAIYLNVSGQQFYLGKTAYITILTGSMSVKNPQNPHCSSLPDNQIEQYALVGIEKSDSFEKYDIIAFAYGKTVYVHRIVDITEQNGVKYYTTMGDANASSASFETDITADRIVGKYTGKKSLTMGYIFSALKSQVGISTVIAVAVFLFGADCALSAIGKSERNRKLYVAELLDGENITEENSAAE